MLLNSVRSIFMLLNTFTIPVIIGIITNVLSIAVTTSAALNPASALVIKVVTLGVAAIVVFLHR